MIECRVKTKLSAQEVEYPLKALYKFTGFNLLVFLTYFEKRRKTIIETKEGVKSLGYILDKYNSIYYVF